MKWSRLAIAGALFFGLALVGVAGDADNAKKIVGVWKVSKSDEGPKEGKIEFTKDGKLKLTAKMGDKDLTINGTYKIKGDKITVTITFMDKSHTDTGTIKKLTEKQLIIEGEKGKSTEFERVK
jgi:uncharacterized protein (TIGR03066 family)